MSICFLLLLKVITWTVKNIMNAYLRLCSQVFMDSRPASANKWLWASYLISLSLISLFVWWGKAVLHCWKDYWDNTCEVEFPTSTEHLIKCWRVFKVYLSNLHPFTFHSNNIIYRWLFQLSLIDIVHWKCMERKMMRLEENRAIKTETMANSKVG